MVSRLSRNRPLPEALSVRVEDAKIQRAFDTLATPLRAIIQFIQPFVQPEKFQNMTLLNSWVDYDGVFYRAQFKKSPLGRVELRGLVRRTVAGFTTPIAILPLGYRPSFRCGFTTTGNGRYARVDVHPSGVILVDVADSATPEASLFLDGVSFSTEA